MANLINILNDGGILISYPILILLVVILILFFRALLGKAGYSKTKSLLISLGWFTIVWGYLGRTIGLIRAFDKIQAAGDISPSMFAIHLKMALVGPLVGIFVFLVARLLVIILISMEKKTTE